MPLSDLRNGRIHFHARTSAPQDIPSSSRTQTNNRFIPRIITDARLGSETSESSLKDLSELEPAKQAVVHTRQRDETKEERDISRIVETLGIMGEIFRKAGGHRLTDFHHFKDGQHFMANTVVVKSSRHMGFCALLRA
jgi:hypothetical protein